MSLLEQYEAKLKAAEAKPKSLLEMVEEKLNQSPGKPDVTTFNAWAALHRDHQQVAINAASENDNGQIIIPTGTGKTRIQIHLHVSDMIRMSDMNQTGVYVIGAHRLLLCAQLMDDLRDLCIKCRIPINVLYVGSARHDDKPIYDRYFAQGITQDTFETTFTTSMEDIENFRKKTLEQKRHLLVVSTYHSFDRLKVLPYINICTYDEAHTTVAEDFSENIFESVKPNIHRNYFFTATRRVRGKQFGMNDIERYGQILCAIPPREMISAGEIVMPRLHIMKHKDEELGSDKDEELLVYSIKKGFEEHKKQLAKDSANPDDIGAKLLVACKGSHELNLVQESVEFKEWCEKNNIKVFSFSSKYGSYENFEEEQNRTKVYESLKNLGDKEDAIFLHIDILTEGIDLPSITAVMLLRHLNTAKLMQTLGRALRLLKSDRARLYSGDLEVTNRAAYTKPYAYVMLPMHFNTLNASSIEMKCMLRTILTEYGIPTEEFLPQECKSTENKRDDDVVTETPGADRRSMEKEYPLIHLIEEFVLGKFGEGLPENRLSRYVAITDMLKISEDQDIPSENIETDLFDALMAFDEGDDTDA